MEFPTVDGLRPTADRVRETLFNWLQDSIQGEVCLDLFAGSGALGLEALSRGAKHVDFVEKNGLVANCIRGNAERFEVSNATVYCADASRWLEAQCGEAAKEMPKYGLVFLDPPFSEAMLEAACIELNSSGLLRKGCLIYVESGSELAQKDIPDNWHELKRKKTGSVFYSLYQLD